MGLYDEIWWEAELPSDHPPTDRLFQTKSLDPCLDRYVVTAEGRLRLVGNGWCDDEDFKGGGEQEGTDVNFHGDIRLVSLTPGREEYMARFTHGTLEWIRPTADAPRSLMAEARRKALEGATET